MKYFYFFVSILLMSCVEDNMSITHEETGGKQIEICHNPQSKNHKQICTEQCFVPNRENYSFCWVLKEEDCYGPIEHEWQKNSCHFFD